MIRDRALRIFACALVGSTTVLTSGPSGAAEAIQEIVVSAQQLPPSVSEPVYATTFIDREALAQSGEARLDDVLRSIPGFGLFRRQSSRSSHPTTQGVTLRGLGPSGAGRTLVLLDGVPLNDPFGGWIDWSRIPSASLQSTLITRGGGAGPWGNTALAGVIRLVSRNDAGTHGWGEVRGDSVASIDGTASEKIDLGGAQIFGTAHGHRSDGVYLIRKDQRGAVDVRTPGRGYWVQGGVHSVIGNDISVTATGNYSEDHYVNGISAAISNTRNADASLSLVHDGGRDGVSWESHAYVRDGRASSMFTSVNATRTIVTPSLDQFRVPATAVGGNAVVRLPVSSAATLEMGADVRAVDGATNENFTFVGNAFTRVRHAGGSQLVTGGFAEVNWLPMPTVTITAGGRFDYWEQNNGVRTETILATGALARNSTYPDRTGNVGNFRFGTRVEATDTLTLRATGYSGFRIPTLNELYRPFRVGNDITEANPALKPERLKGIEGGAEWRVLSNLRVSGTFFHTWLANAVGNITISTTPGPDPTTGAVVPVGGVLRQRQNVDQIIANGFESEVVWGVTEAIDLSASYLFTTPRITRAPAQPNLVGLRLAQVARNQAVFTAIFRPDTTWTLKSEVRVSSSQFDDDQNTRLLKSFAVVDLYADHEITAYATAFVGVENLFNAVTQAGRSADGLITVGSPLTVSGGLRVRF